MNLCKFNYIWKQFSTINYAETANIFLPPLARLLDLILSICSDMERERERWDCINLISFASKKAGLQINTFFF
jgi:hypothetical protein